MSSLGSQPQVARVFQSALRQVVQVTEAERSVILFGEGMEEPKVRAVLGFPSDNFWLAAPLSLTLLRNVCKTGEPVEVSDVEESPGLQAELSLVLANVRSLACAPIWSSRGNVVGLIYADWVGKASRRPRILPRLQEVARQIESFLRKVEAGEPNLRDPFDQSLVERPRNVPAPTPPITRVRRQFTLPDARSRSIFFRSLATMFGAGLPLASSLYTLSKSPGSMGPISEELARRLERGQSLATAAAELQVFPSMVSSILRAGEKSGRLHQCLDRLAELEDGSYRRWSKLRAALVYPAFVLVGCSLFLLLAPAAMLSAQTRMLASLHTPLPWVSQILLGLYAALSKPWVWIPLAGSAVLGWRKRRHWMGPVVTQLRRWPPLDSLLISYEMSQWAELLALQLQSGLSILNCLSGHASLRQSLLDGEELSVALKRDGFPRIASEMVRAGEESGRLGDMLNWLARHYEEDFLNRLEGSLRLIEPLVMGMLGIVAGALMIATLLPMSKALQSL
jgi:type II secretory pathway component PulF